MHTEQDIYMLQEVTCNKSSTYFVLLKGIKLRTHQTCKMPLWTNLLSFWSEEDLKYKGKTTDVGITFE